jgi:hypothetical protein
MNVKQVLATIGYLIGLVSSAILVLFVSKKGNTSPSVVSPTVTGEASPEVVAEKVSEIVAKPASSIYKEDVSEPVKRVVDELVAEHVEQAMSSAEKYKRVKKS